MAAEPKHIASCVCFLIALTVILCLMSLEGVEPIEYGILRSKITGNIDT